MKLYFFLIILIFLFSCHPKPPKFTIKIDSTEVIYRAAKDSPVYSMMGLYQITQNFVPKDSGSSEGEWKIDTAWVLKIPSNDTLFDSFHKPKYDLFHHIRYTFRYQAFYKSFIQIVDVPRSTTDLVPIK